MLTGLYVSDKKWYSKSLHTIMHLPFVNLGTKFQPHSFDAHRVEMLFFTA